MSPEQANAATTTGAPPGRPRDAAALTRTILDCASRGLSRTDFWEEISKALLSFAGCDALEARLSDRALHYRWEYARRPQPGARFELMRWIRGADGKVVPASADPVDLERLCRDVAAGRFDSSQPGFTDTGSFWTGDTWEPIPLGGAAADGNATRALCVGGHHRSLVILRFVVDEATIGLLHLKSEAANCFTRPDVERLEGLAQTIGLAVANWRAQYALRERVKELTCLYGIAHVAERTDGSLEELLQQAVALLPPAWQHPDIAAAQIVVDARTYATPGFQPGRYRQSADIVVEGRRRGVVEVHYREDRPEFSAGAFLAEEEKLIAAVAREIALTVERKDAERERTHLQRQLIHADRLATIGQLAAGVAHELNEPLGSILGFAQLAAKCPGLPEAAARDIEKIVTGSLYAREVVRKLMVFARQVPARKTRVNVNQVIEEGLYFLEARCARTGTRIVRELAPALPEIEADAAQLKQVLVNLVVNALQAMPEGGTLTVGTRAADAAVVLWVADTGTGIPDEIMGKIFLPFFSTKDVTEGTGLGLSVVHGIITSHGGSIDVQSQPGQGTRFEIRLPVARSGADQENGAHEQSR